MFFKKKPKKSIVDIYKNKLVVIPIENNKTLTVQVCLNGNAYSRSDNRDVRFSRFENGPFWTMTDVDKRPVVEVACDNNFNMYLEATYQELLK